MAPLVLLDTYGSATYALLHRVPSFFDLTSHPHPAHPLSSSYAVLRHSSGAEAANLILQVFRQRMMSGVLAHRVLELYKQPSHPCTWNFIKQPCFVASRGIALRLLLLLLHALLPWPCPAVCLLARPPRCLTQWRPRWPTPPTYASWRSGR